MHGRSCRVTVACNTIALPAPVHDVGGEDDGSSLRGLPAIGRSALERKAFAPLVCTHVCVMALGVSLDYETRVG